MTHQTGHKKARQKGFVATQQPRQTANGFLPCAYTMQKLLRPGI